MSIFRRTGWEKKEDRIRTSIHKHDGSNTYRHVQTHTHTHAHAKCTTLIRDFANHHQDGHITCTFIDAWKHTKTHTRAHTPAERFLQSATKTVRALKPTRACARACMHVCVEGYVSTSVYVYMHACVRACVCVRAYLLRDFPKCDQDCEGGSQA
jgi:hypothetical protein